MPSAIPTRPISLLWPPGTESPIDRQTPGLSAATAADLALDTTIQALGPGATDERAVRAILLSLCTDSAVIGYRQDVLDDLLRAAPLRRGLEALLPEIGTVERFRYVGRPGDTPLHEVVWRVGQLEAYVACVNGLDEAFKVAEEPIHAAGLCALRDQARALRDEPLFRQLEADLPGMVEAVRSIAGVTIGVNLDHQLRPVGATLLDVRSQPFRGETPSLFGFLFGRGERDSDEGIAPLHAVPRGGRSYPAGIDVSDPMLYPLFRDLAQVLKQSSRPVARALQRYIHLNVPFLENLRAELTFYLGAVRLIERLRAAGLPMCRPEIVPADARVCEVEDLFNLNLALRGRATDAAAPIVTNTIAFGEAGRVFILTGPNQGGKTTFTQAVGQAFVLAQAGLYVPGRRARISPADRIFTHFPVEEAPEMEAGRLGEESARLGEIFSRATRHSVILLNESLSSTSAGESLYLASDIVRALRLLGARAIFATHLHELAASVDALNAETPGDSAIVSLVSLVEERPADNGTAAHIRQTFRIVPGPPRGRSYAREIAARYGISFEQLERLLRERGVTGDGE